MVASEPVIPDPNLKFMGGYRADALERLSAGATPDKVIAELEQRGLDHLDAVQLVRPLHAQFVQAAEAEAFTPATLIPAALAALAAALIGGVVWAALIVVVNYEVGVLAAGIGVLAGKAVLLGAKNRKGIPLQVIAVAASLLGIAAGKYLAFFYMFRQAVAEQYGTSLGNAIFPWSQIVIHFFADNVSSVISGYDLLWVAFAVIAAWRIPKALLPKLRQ